MPLDPHHQEVHDAPIENGDEAGYPGDYSDDANGRYVIINSGDDVHHGGGEEGHTLSLRSLHPYTRPLTVSDLDSCIALENAAFAENERCSPDKVSPVLICHVSFLFLPVITIAKVKYYVPIVAYSPPEDNRHLLESFLFCFVVETLPGLWEHWLHISRGQPICHNHLRHSKQT